MPSAPSRPPRLVLPLHCTPFRTCRTLTMYSAILYSSDTCLIKFKGLGTIHLRRYHEASSPKTPSGLCYWFECYRGGICQDPFHKGKDCSASCIQIQWRRFALLCYDVAPDVASIFLGHINHSLFWRNLSPQSELGGKLESGPLKHAIERDFGSVEAFKTKFNTVTAAIQGSGWGWLVCSDEWLVLVAFDTFQGLQHIH